MSKKERSNHRLLHPTILIGATIAILLFLVLLLNSSLQGNLFSGTTPFLEENKTLGRVLYIGSHDDASHFQAEVARKVRRTLEANGAEFALFTPPLELGDAERAVAIQQEITTFSPNAIIVSDHSLFTHFTRTIATDIPIVLGGLYLNKTFIDSIEGNIVGISEASFAESLYDSLRTHAKGERIGFLSADTANEYNGAERWNEIFGEQLEKISFVKTFEEWKQEFTIFQEQVDILYLGSILEITDWDHDAATKFIHTHTHIPTGSELESVSDYALLTFARIPAEQGSLIVDATTKILQNASIADVGITPNKKRKIILNFLLADQLDIVFPPLLIKNADVIDREGKRLLTGRVIEEI